jgi:hypothetical protein
MDHTLPLQVLGIQRDIKNAHRAESRPFYYSGHLNPSESSLMAPSSGLGKEPEDQLLAHFPWVTAWSLSVSTLLIRTLFRPIFFPQRWAVLLTPPGIWDL